MAAEEKLDDAQRRFVVMALACYDTPSAVAAAICTALVEATGRRPAIAPGGISRVCGTCA